MVFLRPRHIFEQYMFYYLQAISQPEPSNHCDESRPNTQARKDENLGTRLKPAKSYYVGTTARSQHARNLDHQKALSTLDKKNALVKHHLNFHSNTDPKFTIHTVGSHKFNLNRQILEGLTINKATESCENLLNSKSEWGRAELYRLRIENSQGS